MREFIGYEKIIQGFFRRVDNGTLSHAHLIIGPNGIGKSILARIFALRILNKDKDIDYVDIVNYRPSKASMGVDEVREIIEEVSKRPYEGDKKVIIIHEGSKLTIQAQNALLKTIEEPPQGVYIILLAESLETLLETIKSRCNIIKFDTLKELEIEKYLIKENLLDKSRKDVEIKLLNGSLENVNNLDSMLENYDYLKVLVSYIKKKDIIQALNNGLLLYESKDDIINLLDLLNIVFLEERLTKCVFVVENTKIKILQNNNYNMCIDNLIMKSIDSI